MEGKIKTIDLFAGIGGVRLGFERAGFETVYANDFDRYCKATYDLNFSDPKLEVKDIRAVKTSDLPEFDFLLGGFPCQAFSIAGYQNGFDDDRGNLFFEIVRILKERKPMGFMLENVKNLQTHNEKKTFSTIKSELEKLGYHINAKVLNSMEYGGVPQNRERIYIVGFLNPKHLENFNWPKKIACKIDIKGTLESEVDDKYYYENKPLYSRLKQYHFNPGVVYQWRRQYVRENKSGVCPTLTANMGTGGHNVPLVKDDKGIRKMTPRECARLQGFPDNYQLPHIAESQLYKQLGNSVTVTVIESMANEIRKAIENKETATFTRLEPCATPYF